MIDLMRRPGPSIRVAVALCLVLAGGCSGTVAGTANPDPVVAAGLVAAASTPVTSTASITPTPPTPRPSATQTATSAPTTSAPTTPQPSATQNATSAPATATSAATPSTVDQGGGAGPTSSVAPSTTASPSPATRPDQVDPTELFTALTAALRTHRRAAFLARFRGAAATAAGQWWDNLAAIGFDGGAVGVYRGQAAPVALAADGTGSLPLVLAGVHATSDRTDGNGGQYVPSTAYRWTVRYDSGRLQVTGWTSLQHAPWDCDCRLHIARSGNAVVAAYPAEAPLADRVVDDVAAAVRWSGQFSRSVDADWPPLTGAVAFITAKPTLMAQWLRLATDHTTNDLWAHPPPAFTYFLPGYDGPAVGLHRGSDFGGARIILGPDALDDTTEQLVVHELVHYRLSTDATASGFLTEHAWVEEGVAQMVQQIYVGTPAGDAAAGEWVYGTRRLGLGITGAALDANFRGRPPSTDELYGADRNSRFFWYQIAASVYNYLAVRYGLRTALEVADRAHAGASPFALVPDPAKNAGTLPAATVQKAWASWVRQTYG
jgi:hypothetical protein